MSGDFSINHIKTLCSYIYDGGCIKQFNSLCDKAARGEMKGISNLADVTVKTIGTAVVAGIVSSIVGMGVVIVPASSALIFANGIYHTDSLRQLTDTPTNLFSNIKDKGLEVYHLAKTNILNLIS